MKSRTGMLGLVGVVLVVTAVFVELMWESGDSVEHWPETIEIGRGPASGARVLAPQARPAERLIVVGEDALSKELWVTVTDERGRKLSDVPVYLQALAGPDVVRVASGRTGLAGEPAALSMRGRAHAGDHLVWAVGVAFPSTPAPMKEVGQLRSEQVLKLDSLQESWYRPLTVVITDPAGEAIAGVPVVLETRTVMSPIGSSLEAMAMTEGQLPAATLSTLGVWKEVWRADVGREPLEVHVRCAPSSLSARSVRLDFGKPAPDVITLELTRFGWVDVTAVTAEGTPLLPADVAVSWWVLDEGAGQNERFRGRLVSDVLRVGPVPVGCRIGLVARGPGGLGSGQVQLDGPSHLAEVVTSEVVLLSHDVAEVRGRLILADGRPLSGQAFLASLRSNYPPAKPGALGGEPLKAA